MFTNGKLFPHQPGLFSINTIFDLIFKITILSIKFKSQYNYIDEIHWIRPMISSNPLYITKLYLQINPLNQKIKNNTNGVVYP